MKFVETILYTLSTLFFYPVIVVLLFLLAKVVYDLGQFCKELWRRWKTPAYRVAPFIAQMTAQEKTSELTLQTILQQFEISAQRKIRAAGYSIKMGPTLGLIGTLTPMAKALSGLAQGNLSSLSDQMISAFSTTVLGLVVGGIAYTMMHMRMKWHREDVF